jgi:sugar/nucleoside kinase (ribokinase family)
MRSNYEVVCIGDVVIDAFIRLHEASVHCNLNHTECQLCMTFADKIPYETLEVIPAVGNSSNVAVGLSRLGFKTAMVCAIGDDLFGKQVLEAYEKEGISKEFVKINKGVPTNYHFVLNYQAERTILIKHNSYDYVKIKTIGDVPWIYFSSISESAVGIHDELADYLESHPHTKLGFNPGTFQIKLGTERLARIYKSTYVLFVNREEAQKILKTEVRDITFLFEGLHKLGPKIVVITDGPEAAYASDGENHYKAVLYPDPKPPFERTGAGDAFSAGVMGALMSGLGLEKALLWAPIESMSVVQYTGAQKGLLTKSQIVEYLEKAPESYRVRPF